MTARQPLTPHQQARAYAALDIWYANPGGSDYRVPCHPGWSAEEMEQMHAALEAPDTDAALAAFGAVPGTWLSTAEQDAENRSIMTGLRERLRST